MTFAIVALVWEICFGAHRLYLGFLLLLRSQDTGEAYLGQSEFL